MSGKFNLRSNGFFDRAIACFEIDLAIAAFIFCLSINHFSCVKIAQWARFERPQTFKLNVKTLKNAIRRFRNGHKLKREGNNPFGAPTMSRPWNQLDNAMDRAKARATAAFEFFTKLGVPYYTFHDRDLAPEGTSLADTNNNLDEIVALP